MPRKKRVPLRSISKDAAAGRRSRASGRRPSIAPTTEEEEIVDIFREAENIPPPDDPQIKHFSRQDTQQSTDAQPSVSISSPPRTRQRVQRNTGTGFDLPISPPPQSLSAQQPDSGLLSASESEIPKPSSASYIHLPGSESRAGAKICKTVNTGTTTSASDSQATTAVSSARSANRTPLQKKPARTATPKPHPASSSNSRPSHRRRLSSGSLKSSYTYNANTRHRNHRATKQRSFVQIHFPEYVNKNGTLHVASLLSNPEKAAAFIRVLYTKVVGYQHQNLTIIKGYNEQKSLTVHSAQKLRSMSQRVDYLERTKINHRRSRQDSPIEDASTITSAAQLWDKERKTYDKKLYGLQKQNQALFDRVRFLENLAPDHNINSEPNVSGAKTKAKTPALPGADPAAEADSDTDSDASIDSEASADAEVTASVDTVTVETQTSYNFDGYIQSLEKKLEETRVTMRKKDMDLMKVKELQEDLEKSDRAGEESKILIDQLTQQLASVRDELAAEEDDAKEKQMTLHVRIDKLVKELEEKKKETQAFVNQEAHQTQVMQVLKTKHGRELAELRKDYDNRIATLSAKVEEKVVERKALVAQHDVNRAQTEAEVNLRIEKIEEEMNERMSDKEKELMAAHQKELKTAKRKHSKEMRELNKKADQRIAELSTQMTERELELERFTDQGIQHTETVKALRKELAGKMNDLRKDYNQVTQDHNQLQEENDALLRELECSQTSLKQHIEETVLLQAELKKREDRRTKEGNLLAELESKMQSRVKSIAKLRERLSARDMSIIEFEEKIAELECALEETVKKAMDDREQIGLILKREEHIHRHRLDQLQRKYQRKLKERELIHREQLDDLRGELQNARHTISELTKKYDDDLLDLRCILLDFKDVKQNDKERSSASGGTDGITSDEHVTGSNSAASSANHANRNNDVNAIHEGGNDLSPHLSLSSLTLHSTGQPSASRSNPPPVSSLSTTTSNEACAPTTPPAPPRLSSLSASELTIAIPSVSASDIEPEVASDVASEAESCDADLDVSVVHFHQQLNEDDDDSSGDDIFHNSDGTDEKRIDNHADEGWRKYLPYADSDSSSSG